MLTVCYGPNPPNQPEGTNREAHHPEGINPRAGPEAEAEAERRFVTADRIVESRGGYDPEGDGPTSPSLRRKHLLVSGMRC